MVAEYLSGLSFLADPMYWVVLLLAVVLVGAFGVIPGVGGPVVMAIALPVVIFNIEDPVVGLTFLAAMAGLGNSLDSIPAVLVGYPSASNQVTFLEGHQLAQRGQGAYTLGGVYAVSAIGGIVGALALLAVLPIMRPIMLRFSFPEIAALAIFGVLMVSVLSRGAMLKGLAAGGLGVFLGTVGTSFIAGEARYSFGTRYLFDGLPLIPVLIGFFALPELVDLTMKGQSVAPPGKVSNRDVWAGFHYGLRRWKMTVRQSVFGVFMGAVPGIGGAVVDWLAYALGMAFTKDKSQFGKGSIDGVLFAESAQNSKEGGQAIPTLAFGIPGGLSWAIVLVGMIAYGVVPGPGMLEASRHLDVTMSLVTTLALGNLFMTLIGLVATGYLTRLTLIPYTLLAAAVLPLAFVGAYQANSHWGDLAVVCAMGAVGLTMKWLGWPRPPLMLGFILGPIIERNLWPAYSAYGAGMFSRPFFVGILVISVAVVAFLTWTMRQRAPQMAVVAASQGLAPDAVGGQPSVALGGPSVPATSPTHEGQSFRIVWRWRTLFPLFLLVAMVLAFMESQNMVRRESIFMPQWVTLFMIALLSVQVAWELLGRERAAEIMDIGMRSGTNWAAAKKLMVVCAWIAGFLAGVFLLGMPLASVLWGAVFGMAHVPWKGRGRLWGLVPAGLLALVVFGFFGNIFYVEWPRTIWTWFK